MGLDFHIQASNLILDGIVFQFQSSHTRLRVRTIILRFRENPLLLGDINEGFVNIRANHDIGFVGIKPLLLDILKLLELGQCEIRSHRRNGNRKK